MPAEKLWKSVTSVSNAGAKKGRGRGAGRIRIRDLNRGQLIGVGKVNMLWPGLSAPVIRGRELLKQQRLPDDPERYSFFLSNLNEENSLVAILHKCLCLFFRLEKLVKIRDSMIKFRRMKLSPIERGWSGSKLPGRSIGPPDKIGEGISYIHVHTLPKTLY